MPNFWKYTIAVLIILFFLTDSAAQKKRKKKKGKAKNNKEFRLLDTNSQQLIRTIDSSYYLHFPNINRIPYYRDEKEYSRILELQKEKDWKNLYPLLEAYVVNFGITNFSRDTELLWTLAKIAEQNGEMEKAKLFYKLVLKHHNEEMDVSKILQHFDSITVNEKDYYVELEYYYELVEYRKESDTLHPPRG
jgi:hypothetical protein